MALTMVNATTFPGAFPAGRQPSSSSARLSHFCASLFPADARTLLQAVPDEQDGDALWLAKVRGGDEDAARALVRRLYPTVIKLVRARPSRRTSEEDLAQIVFAKIFAKLNQFSGGVPLEHWVSRIVVNT